MERTIEQEVKILKIRRFSIHDGPGIRTTVFLKGCPLKCIWCHSPEGISPDISIWYDRNLCIACGTCVGACVNNSLELNTDNDPYVRINPDLCNNTGKCVRSCPTGALQFTGSISSVSDIVEEVEKDILYYRVSGGGVTLSGGEPLYQPESSIEILKACRTRNIHTAIETSLYCEKETVSRVLDFVDLFIIDMKIYDPVQHILYTGKSNEIIKDNFRIVSEAGKDILVRIPLIKNITDTEENKIACESFVHEINEKIPVEYISYNPLTGNNYERLGIPFLLK